MRFLLIYRNIRQKHNKAIKYLSSLNLNNEKPKFFLPNLNTKSMKSSATPSLPNIKPKIYEKEFNGCSARKFIEIEDSILKRFFCKKQKDILMNPQRAKLASINKSKLLNSIQNTSTKNNKNRLDSYLNSIVANNSQLIGMT